MHKKTEKEEFNQRTAIYIKESNGILELKNANLKLKIQNNLNVKLDAAKQN